MNRLNKTIIAILVAASTIVLGCANSESVATASAPPPPPPAEGAAARQTYDYEHTLKHAGERRLRRKLVVALVRYAEDRPLEDVPFGVEPNDQDVQYLEQNTLEMNFQVGAGNAAANAASNAASGGSSTPIRPGAVGFRSRHIIKRELQESGAFVVVERDDILDILRELRFGQTEYVNPETRPELGEVMSVQYLLEASIGMNEDRGFKNAFDEGPSYGERGRELLERVLDSGAAGLEKRCRELRRQRLVNARSHQMQSEYPYGVFLSLFDVRTSEVVAQAYGIGGTRQEAVRDAVEELADLCTDIPQPPRVAWVNNERVFVDLGENDHVQIGGRYRYYSQGTAIRNSAGQIIGHDEHEGGLIEIVRVEPRMSIGRIVEQSAPPAVGDRIAAAEE